jgi:hypothetical protein
MGVYIYQWFKWWLDWRYDYELADVAFYITTIPSSGTLGRLLREGQ